MCGLLFEFSLVFNSDLRSLVRGSVLGFSSVTSHPSMAIWVQTKRVRVTRVTVRLSVPKNHSRMRWIARADPVPRPRPTVYVVGFVHAFIAFILLLAIIVKIKSLSH